VKVKGEEDHRILFNKKYCANRYEWESMHKVPVMSLWGIILLVELLCLFTIRSKGRGKMM